MRARRTHADDASNPGERLAAAQAALAKFTLAGCTSAALQPRDLTDPFQVAALELLEKRCSCEVRRPAGLGAWLRNAINRGAGACTPLRGAADGLHVLVLDARAVAELLEQLAIHDRRQGDLVRLRRMRGAA